MQHTYFLMLADNTLAVFRRILLIAWDLICEPHYIYGLKFNFGSLFIAGIVAWAAAVMFRLAFGGRD